ncbi:MAG: outer membrane protein assembly factor BamA [Verrucomicrobia bacterium]|nr:outer membrane protein assembly factor BamA [Verrucomicrobiota bacterium]MDA1006544.1 outer membrane protein assembly factor BamA [Verrucomicrobiota bacterium]
MLGAACWPSLVHAQDDFTGKKVSSIVFKYRGPETVDEAVLRNFMSIKVGSPFDPELLDNDIKRLYESGLVDDVRFLAEPAGDSIQLIAEVVTRPVLGGVGFVGHTIFSDEKLAKVSELKAGGTLSDVEILAARRKIEEQYRSFGYPDVLVTHRLQETERPGVSDLIFVIDEGAKSEVRKIRFVGNTAFKSVDLRREMETKQKNWLSWINKSGRIDPAELEQDFDRILDYYRNNGYLRAKIVNVDRTPVKDGRVDLVITIEEGGKYTVQSVGFGKMSVFTPDQLNAALSLNAGEPYSAKKVRDDMRMIKSYYGSRGYADVTVSPEIRDVGPGLISVLYKITEGGISRVGRVNIEGNVKTQDRVIRRELPLKPGDNFNSVEMDTTERRMKNLNYFDQTQVTSSPSAQSGYRDVNILVREKKTGQLSFGAGFSSIDNIVGYINVEESNFDITNWKGGFKGAGQRMGAQIRAGAERQDFKVSLVEPWFMGRRLALGGELFYSDLSYLSNNYTQGSVGGEIFVRKPMGRRSYIKAAYRMENIDVDVDTIPGVDYTGPGGVPDGMVDPSLFTMEDGSFLRSALSLTYTYDSRDSNIMPRKGGRANVGVTLAGGPLGGDVDTYTMAASGSKHWQLPWDMIVNLSGSYETVDSTDGSPVPIFERSFLGGSRNLRGFEYRDLGPRDPVTGDALGGQTSAFGSVELTFPIIENVRGAAFYDMGFVSSDVWDVSIDTLNSDAGMGLRLNLPFGPLALDYALPLQVDDPASDQGGQFNFYLNYQY